MVNSPSDYKIQKSLGVYKRRTEVVSWRLIVPALAVIEALVFVVIGTLLGLVLSRTLGKPGSPASVRLVRTARTADGREETRLFVNDAAILTASNDGVRLAEYADEVEQLEAVAARLAGSMGVSVEFSRVGARTSSEENGIQVRSLPAEQPLSSDEDVSSNQEDELGPRRARLNDQQSKRR